jgi:hypothetical protein
MEHMKTTFGKVSLVFLIFLIAGWVTMGIVHKARTHREEKIAQELFVENSKVARYGMTSAERAALAVVTLPDGDQVVGLKDGEASYTYALATKKNKANIGTITLGDMMAKKLIEATSSGVAPRLDLFFQ